MDALIIVGTGVLAAVLAGAGVGKLLDLDGSRRAVRGFGVPDPLAGPVGVALPVAEIAIAVLLLPASTRLYAAIAAFALFVGFCVAMALALARGKTPDCHCFGRLHSEPIGRGTLLRSGVLAALAAAVAVGTWNDPAPSAFGWVGDLTGTQWLVLALAAALAATVAVGGYAFVHLMQAYGRVLERLDRLETRLAAAGFDLDEPEDVPEIGIEPGADIPDLELADLDGRRVALRGLAAAEVPTLLLFTSPTCGPCATLMPEVARWQDEHADEFAIAILSSGEAAAVRADAGEHGLERVFIDVEHAALDAFGANGTPSAVLLAPDGTIASWVAQGSDWIERLVEMTLRGGEDEEAFDEGLPVGEPVPDVELRDIGGKAVSLASLRGEESVLLFWNPGCGYCRSMHEDILDWERRRNGGSPELVVVSSGTVADTAGEGFASMVLLDEGFAAGSALGVGGTPMAIRIDAEGRVASDLAAGGDAVLELLMARVS